MPGSIFEGSFFAAFSNGKAYRRVTTALYVATMILLIVGAVWIIAHTVLVVAREDTFSSILPEALGGIVLAIIVLELLETVYKQVARGPDAERLTFPLVMNFLIIGIVSAVRHILVIGAQLSLPDQPTPSTKHISHVGVRDAIAMRDGLLRELLTNVALILVLLVGIFVVRTLERPPYGDEPDGGTL